MKADLHHVLSAIRGQPWAILPEYLDAIEVIALRALESDVLRDVAGDGHAARLAASRSALAAVGTPLAGSMASTLRDGAAVIPVFGAIFPRASVVNSSTGGTALDTVMHDLRVALASDAVDRIVMVYDTPGGVVSGLAEAADSIRLSAKPVTGFVTGIAASAGYWLASQSQELVLERAASVGSIGVVYSTTRQEAPGADGRRSYEVVSSNAPRKRPDPSTEEGRAAIQEEVDAIEAVFMADVARGRGVTAARVRDDFGQGGMKPARAAIEVGMADRIGTLDSIFKSSRRTGMTSTAPRRALAAAELHTRRLAADRS